MATEWSEADLATLGEMRARGCGPDEIAATLDRTRKGVSAKIAYLKLSPEVRRERKKAERMRASPRYRSRKQRKESAIWPRHLIEQLLQLRDVQRKQWAEIGVILGCTARKASSRYHWHNRTSLGCREPASALNIIPEHVHDERRRRQMLEPSDLTAAFCGDPLPGFSALERRA